ncbi:putative transposable element [Trichonephila clavipes]|nr:putative transposable element [Trichonephila clavipes]
MPRDEASVVICNSASGSGKGSSTAKTFCAVMNLPPPPAKFQRYNGIILESHSKVSDASMKKPVEETVEINNKNKVITAAFDGSWQKRGHTSLNGELWFQQDGATCHTARATIDLLKDTFGDRLISRFGPVNWPPRSCDLTPLDYFLWGYVKSLVYADKPQTLDHLEDNICRVIADIPPQMLEKVIENWTSKLDYIRASRYSYMLEIIFKM